jgi:hypothetical protein
MNDLLKMQIEVEESTLCKLIATGNQDYVATSLRTKILNRIKQMEAQIGISEEEKAKQFRFKNKEYIKRSGARKLVHYVKENLCRYWNKFDRYYHSLLTFSKAPTAQKEKDITC